MARQVAFALTVLVGTVLYSQEPTIPAARVSVTAEDAVKPVESTMAYKLLSLEGGVRELPDDADNLLRAVIDDATNAAIRTHRHPRSKEEALSVLRAIQTALARHNFLQPPQEKDWPNTMGIALRRLDLSPSALTSVLSFPDNAKRKEHFNLQKPFYFVDCDMGSQIFMAVGERLGWDIRLVELPQHNFVRWHMNVGVTVAWDWTHGDAREDGEYPDDDVRLRRLYLRSFEYDEAEAYFVGLIASEAKKPDDAERLFLTAIKALPHHPLTLNNFAWLYATTPEFKNKSHVAVAYSLGAWSLRPQHGNFADTVACSLALNGDRALAEQVEQFAIAHPNSASQREAFKKNLARIKAGEPCR